MLKSPIRLVGGYGSFVQYVDRTAEEAWSAYGRGNGVDSLAELVDKVEMFAKRRSSAFVPSRNPLIGCIEIADMVALDDDQFLDPEKCGHPFPRQVVKLKYFDGPDGFAARLRTRPDREPFVPVHGKPSRKQATQKERKGQSAFRQDILRNYGYRCAIVGETVVELLEAAHIQPYLDERSNHPQNGICLRVDLHRLFDEGLISITETHEVRVSSRLTGTSYARLDGQRIAVPADPSLCPSRAALALHQTNFR